MVVHNGGRIYKDFDKYDKFKIGYREENHQLYLEYNDIIKMYDAILDFMDRAFRIVPQLTQNEVCYLKVSIRRSIRNVQHIKKYYKSTF